MKTIIDERQTQEVLTVEEAAEYLKVSTRQIYRLVESRSIPFFRIGRLIRIPKQKLSEMMCGNPPESTK